MTEMRVELGERGSRRRIGTVTFLDGDISFTVESEADHAAIQRIFQRAEARVPDVRTPGQSLILPRGDKRWFIYVVVVHLYDAGYYPQEFAGYADALSE